MMRKIINKKLFKQVAQRCRICGNDAYAVLDVHRIKHGADGGKYHSDNCVTICSNCHRKVHDGKIVIDKWYFSTSGKLLRIIDENGMEKFI